MARSTELPQDSSLTSLIQKKLTRPAPEPAIGWVDIGDAANPIAPTWENNWQAVPGSTPGFYLGDDGRVRWRGRIQGGDVGTRICSPLPMGFRPSSDVTFILPNDAGGYVHLEVNTDGEATVIAMSTSVVVSA